MAHDFLKKVLSIFLPVLLFLPVYPSLAIAAFDEDMQTLGMYYEQKDLVVSATRNPKPISQAAENITVITAKDIEKMGAHTLVDVFANVPGIQASDQGGPGTNSDFNIWGASNQQHFLLMVDGVTLNEIVDQFVDLLLIPIQNIERVEIIKGPGSSSWGSALGAVINIVTKSPNEDKKFSGTAFFSGGERGTRDTRGELSGTVGPLGYYIFAGNLRSQGFRPNTAIDQNNFYGKFRFDIPTNGALQFTIGYDREIVGNGDLSSFGFLDRLRQQSFFSTLSFNYPVTSKLDLDLSLRVRHLKTHDLGTFLFDDPDNGISAGDTAFYTLNSETTYGGSAKLTWRERNNTLTAGVDYDHLYTSNVVDDEPDKQISDKYGVFLNDTIVLGKFAVTPGIRYDRMRQVGDFFSPSLGVAWNPTDKITLRAYAARGYGLPILNPNTTQQKVTSVHAGVETTYVPWLWLKGTFFWNRLTDVQETHTKQIKQGVEVEGKTVPFFNTSIAAGYTFIDAKDDETGESLEAIPRQLVKLGIYYDDIPHSFRGSLLGRYGWLNSPDIYNGRYKAIIWDLHLSKQVLNFKGTKLDLFFNVHNLFNGSQYSLGAWKNARRWFEGGLKFEF